MGKPLTRHRMVGLGSPSASHNRMTLVPVLYTPLCGFFTQRGGSGNKGKGGRQGCRPGWEARKRHGLRFRDAPAGGRHGRASGQCAECPALVRVCGC